MQKKLLWNLLPNYISHSKDAYKRTVIYVFKNKQWVKGLKMSSLNFRLYVMWWCLVCLTGWHTHWRVTQTMNATKRHLLFSAGREVNSVLEFWVRHKRLEKNLLTLRKMALSLIEDPRFQIWDHERRLRKPPFFFILSKLYCLQK